MSRKRFTLRPSSSPSEDGLSPEICDEALLKLCRAGVLELGYDKEEPTVRVTERFTKTIAGCAEAYIDAGGRAEDCLPQGVLLAVVTWFGTLRRADALTLASLVNATVEATG